MLKPISPAHAMPYAPLRLQYPFIIQPKLRGIFGQLVDGRIYSRTKKEFGVLDDFPKFPFYIFGELWNPALSQHDIQGALNRIEPNENTPKIGLHAFDMYDPLRPELTAVERLSILQDAVSNFYVNLSMVRSDISATADAPYFAHLQAGYEGSIYRSLYAPYYPGADTYDVMKRKPWKDTEAVILDVVEGLGKYVGRVGTFKVQWNTLVFYVGGGELTEDMRLEYWLKKPIGKLLTFRYQYLAETGVPQHPQFICLREIS